MRSFPIPNDCNCFTLIGNKLTEGIGVGGLVSAGKHPGPFMRGKRIIRGTQTSLGSSGDEPTHYSIDARRADDRSIWIYMPRLWQRDRLFQLTEFDPERALQAGLEVIKESKKVAPPNFVCSGRIFPSLEIGKRVVVLCKSDSGRRLCFHDRKTLFAQLTAVMSEASTQIFAALTTSGS